MLAMQSGPVEWPQCHIFIKPRKMNDDNNDSDQFNSDLVKLALARAPQKITAIHVGCKCGSESFSNVDYFKWCNLISFSLKKNRSGV